MEKNAQNSTIIERLREERRQVEPNKIAMFAELDGIIDDSTKSLLEEIEKTLSEKKDIDPQSDSVSVQLAVGILDDWENHILIDRKVIEIGKYRRSLSEKSIEVILREYLASNNLATVILETTKRYVKYQEFLAELKNQGLSTQEGFAYIPGYGDSLNKLIVTANLKLEEEQKLALEP